MAYNFIADSVAVAGTGSSANLVASSAGQSISVWQLILTGTSTDTVSLGWTAAGTATTAKIGLLPNTTVLLPYTGCAYAAADVGTAISFTAATTSTLTAYFSKGTGA